MALFGPLAYKLPGYRAAFKSKEGGRSVTVAMRSGMDKWIVPSAH